MSRVSDALRKARGMAPFENESDVRLPAPLVQTVSQGASEDWLTVEPFPKQVAWPDTRLANERAADEVVTPALGELTAMVQRLFQPGLSSESAPRCVMFSAVSADSDVAAVCGGSAEALVRISSGTVCVVDIDLRQPKLDQWFGVQAYHGLAEALLLNERIDNFMMQVRPRLWLVPAGPRAAEAQPLLTLSWLRTALHHLLSICDHVLVSCAPASLHADAGTLGRCTDGVVLVLDAGATRRAAAKRAATALHSSNVTVLGAVLANRTYPIPEALYNRL